MEILRDALQNSPEPLCRPVGTFDIATGPQGCRGRRSIPDGRPDRNRHRKQLHSYSRNRRRHTQHTCYLVLLPGQAARRSRPLTSLNGSDESEEVWD